MANILSPDSVGPSARSPNMPPIKATAETIDNSGTATIAVDVIQRATSPNRPPAESGDMGSAIIAGGDGKSRSSSGLLRFRRRRHAITDTFHSSMSPKPMSRNIIERPTCSSPDGPVSCQITVLRRDLGEVREIEQSCYPPSNPSRGLRVRTTARPLQTCQGRRHAAVSCAHRHEVALRSSPRHHVYGAARESKHAAKHIRKSKI